MAQRFLAIDWDQNQLHVVAATVSGGAVRFTQAVRIDTPTSPNPADAEDLGGVLRERLKAVGIAPAPVLACLGRDRVILKEVHYPAVPEHEEPDVVRYQAIKELTDAPNDVVIDYSPLPSLKDIPQLEVVEKGKRPAPPPLGGERRAQVMIARRELVRTYQTICESAGLRLAGVAPRAYGMAACLRRLLGSSVLVPAPEPANAPIALVTVGEKWAEFCILQGDALLQARTLTMGPGLANEIRRNLAVYSGQHAANPVRAVYLALSGEQAALREKLVESLDVPVHPFDPFAGAEGKQLPTSGRGTFVGAIGLLHLMAQRGQLPVNFIRIKQARPPKNPNQRVYLLLVLLMVILLGGGFLLSVQAINARREKLVELDRDLSDKGSELARERDRRLMLQALHDWETANWPDELYELAGRMPPISRDFRVQSLEGSAEKPQTRVGAGALTLQQQKATPPPPLNELGARPVARLHMKFLAPNEGPLNELNKELLGAGRDRQGAYYRPYPHSANRGVYDKDIYVRKRPPSEYSKLGAK